MKFVKTTDQEIIDAASWANFGDTDVPAIIKKGLFQIAGAFSTGYSVSSILATLGLITPAPNFNITKKGRRQMYYWQKPASKEAQEVVWTDAPTEAGWAGFIQLPDMNKPTLAKTCLDDEGCLRVKDIDYDLLYLIVDVPKGTRYSTSIPQPKERKT